MSDQLPVAGALAGIASPEAFFAMLRARGLTLEKAIAFPDHHDFENEDLNAYAGQTVLCTEKDAVKLFAMPGLSALQLLAVPLAFSPEPAFFAALDELLVSQSEGDEGARIEEARRSRTDLGAREVGGGDEVTHRAGR